jgi:hypothetical protein
VALGPNEVWRGGFIRDRTTGVLSTTYGTLDPYRSAILADAPSAFLRFDETSGTLTADDMGLAPGTHVGGVTVNQAGAFGAGRSVTYNGTTGETTLTTMGTYGTKLASASFDFWIKTTTTALGAVFGEVGTGNNSLVQCLINSVSQAQSTGKMEMYVRNNGATALLDAWVTAPIYDGNWHHVCWVVTSSTTLACYVDGISLAVTYSTQQDISSLLAFDFPMMIGARNVRGTADRFLTGSLDYVAFYPTRLTQAQAQAHIAASTLPSISTWYDGYERDPDGRLVLAV